MSIRQVNKTDGNTDTIIAGSTLWADAPIGAIFAIMSDTIPSGFLKCDGTAYSAANYPELWAILPSTVKDTVNNTFTIDLRESTLKGVGLTSKSNNHYDSDGVALGEFIEDRIKSHTHLMGVAGDFTRNSNHKAVNGDTNDPPISTKSSGSATNEVKAVGVNYIIKAKMVALPADLAAQAQPRELDTPVYVDGQTKTTVESAISGISNALKIEGLSSGQDLNNCYTNTYTKNWGTAASAIISTLVNKPSLTYSPGEAAVVYIPMSPDYGQQFFIHGYGNNTELFTRHRMTNSWGSWTKLH